ncbi:unnamed protein product [Brassica oleracea]
MMEEEDETQSIQSLRDSLSSAPILPTVASATKPPSLLLLSISVGFGSSDSFRQQIRTNRRRRRRKRRLLERGSDPLVLCI